MPAARQLCNGSRRLVLVRRFTEIELTRRCPACGDPLICEPQRGAGRPWAMVPSHLASGRHLHRIPSTQEMPWKE